MSQLATRRGPTKDKAVIATNTVVFQFHPPTVASATYGVAGVAGVTGDPGQPGHVGHVGHPRQAGCDGLNQREARPVATNTMRLLAIEPAVNNQGFPSSEQLVMRNPHQLLRKQGIYGEHSPF